MIIMKDALTSNDLYEESDTPEYTVCRLFSRSFSKWSDNKLDGVWLSMDRIPDVYSHLIDKSDYRNFQCCQDDEF